jgi:3-phenylpropionate/trans-cinnamate dioxygenase ferredoxin reductase subunit
MPEYKYVIIGGGMAGGRACEGIRKVDTERNVALVTEESHRPYERPPLSKGYLVGKQGLDKVYLKEVSYYAEHGIEIISGIRATKVEPAERRVTLDDGRELRYEKLLLATGGRAKRLSIPGADLPGVYTLRRIEDSNAIRQTGQQAKRVVVLGGSFVGSEIAAVLIHPTAGN